MQSPSAQRISRRVPPPVTARVDDADLPEPRRAFSRPIVFVLLLLAILLVLRFTWGWIAERQLEATFAEVQTAAGTRGALDLDEPPLDPQKNAVTFLHRAAEGMTTDLFTQLTRNTNETFSQNGSHTPRKFQAAAQWLESNRDVLDDLTRARELAVRWDPPTSGPARIDPRVAGPCRLACVLGHAALRAHWDHDDAAAIDRLRSVVFISEALAQRPDLETYESATFLWNNVAFYVKRIAPDLRIGTGTAEAPPDDVKALAARLNDDAFWRACANRAARGHMKLIVARAQTIPPGDFTDGARRLALRPYYILDGQMRLREMARAAAALSKLDLRSASAASPRWRGRPPGRSGYIFGDWLPSDPDEYLASNIAPFTLRNAVQRDMAALALAIRLYQHEHAGRLPTTLAELTPEDLVSLPIDPCDPTHQPIRYAGQAKRPFIYSLWNSGQDRVAGGSWAPAPDRSDEDPGWEGEPNLPWFLTPRDPSVPMRPAGS